jgi:hypothetical protein
MAIKMFALCLSNNFGPDFDGGDVLPGLAYEVLGEERGLLRVVDESGEDYLYPANAFHRLSKGDSRVLAKSLAKLAA